MEHASVKLTKILVLFVIGVFIIKSSNDAGFFEAKSHKGRGYYVKIPEGWKKEKPQKDVIYPEGVDVVTFVPERLEWIEGKPDAYISILSKKLNSPIWIQDEFPEILHSLRKAGHSIKDKGEIKIDKVISEWVVYFDEEMLALFLEFYMVTDNSVFYKIQYSAKPDRFNEFRRSFEELRESFKFKFSLY